MNRVPRWRIAAALVVVAGLALYAARFIPIYLHSRQLQNFVTELTARSDSAAKSDDLLRTWVLDKAHEFDLPVKPGDVKIVRSPHDLRIDVRYIVRVTVPGYTVDLHFHPSASNR
ncbi:MAG: hypothetical protein LAP40_14260 [Acidobacteriia bacterium]|nr:hypothetical protein [Terriglobia bacterium]